MTVSSELTYVELQWTGVETLFSPGLVALNVDHVAVRYRPVGLYTSNPLSRGVHYNATLHSSTSAWSATPLRMPAAPGVIECARRTPAVQATDFETLGRYSPAVHETLHDASALRDAELWREMWRTLRLPEAAGYVFPVAPVRKSTTFGFDAAGNPLLAALDLTVLQSIVANGLANPALDKLNRLETVTALRAVPGTVNAAFYCLGHSTNADLGGGVFYWDPASALADDNGMVIVPNGHVGDGRWLRIIEGALTTPMFGGKVDGESDDTDAFKAMFAAMQRLGLPADVFGRQVVREGELIWSADYHVRDIAGPVIRTAVGTTLIAKGVADAPILSILNNPGGTQIAVTGDTAVGSPVITNVTGVAAASLTNGMQFFGPGIPAAESILTWPRPRILSFTQAGGLVTSITLSVDATAAGVAVTGLYALTHVLGWMVGGEIGDLIFEDPSVTAVAYPAVGDQLYPNRHGLLISGLQGIRFGYMQTLKLWGDLCRVYNRVLYNDPVLANPDPYHVFGCQFLGFRTQPGHRGWTLNNDCRSQGFGGNIIFSLHNIHGEFGVWRGAGGANQCLALSCASNRGWAVDWGDTPEFLGGAARNLVFACEIDAPEYGIRIVRHTQLSMRGRINHRLAGAPIQGADPPWPKIAIQLGDGTKATGDLELNFIHRFSTAGLTDANIGVFLDLNNSTSLKRITVRHDIIDINPTVGPFTARFPVAFGKLAANTHSTNLGVRVYEGDRLVYSRERSGRLLASIAAGATIADVGAGFAGASSVVPYTAEILDDSVSAEEAPGNFDPATHKYKCPHRGEYRVSATFALATLAADAQVRIGVMKNTATLVTEKYDRANGANIQTYQIDNVVTCDAGDDLWISATQPSGAALAVSAGAAVAANNRLEITPLNHEGSGP